MDEILFENKDRFHRYLHPSKPEIYEITFISRFKFVNDGNFEKNPFENFSNLF